MDTKIILPSFGWSKFPPYKNARRLGENLFVWYGSRTSSGSLAGLDSKRIPWFEKGLGLLRRGIQIRIPNHHAPKPTSNEWADWLTELNWVVVSNIFYFHPYLGKWSNFTHTFHMGWFNHQLLKFSAINSSTFILPRNWLATSQGVTWKTKTKQPQPDLEGGPRHRLSAVELNYLEDHPS